MLTDDRPPILQVRGLVKDFKGFRAVDDVDLTVRTGSVHALIGPNGAGKSTCFNLISRYLTPTSGKILFKGQDITRQSPSDVARQGLTRSFQLCAVFHSMTVLENVRVALQRKRRDHFVFWRSERSLSALDDQAMTFVEAVGLGRWAGAEASSLSYGRKRALELATTLALDPELMLLDEPFAGMGREDIGTVTELIRAAAVDRTVVIVEHNLSVIAALCDRISVLARGRVLAEGSYAAVSQDPRVVEVYLGSGH